MVKHLEIYRGENEPEDRNSFLWLHTASTGARVLEEYNGSSWVPISSSDLEAKIGDLSDLDTETKTSIVEALNEISGSKLQKPSADGTTGQALLLGADGKPTWGSTETASGAVVYNSEQSLTDGQKAQARTNIGAASREDSDYLGDAVVGAIVDGNDHNSLELLCGQPPILFGAGTPQEAIVPDNWNQFDPETGEGYNWNGLPSAIGQQYINTSVSTGGRYIAGRTSYDKTNANYYVLKWYNS